MSSITTATITADQTAAIIALDKLGMLDATMAQRILGQPEARRPPSRRSPRASPRRHPRSRRPRRARPTGRRSPPRAASTTESLAPKRPSSPRGRKRGAKLCLRGDERTAAMATGGSASSYYKVLATFTKKHGIDF